MDSGRKNPLDVKCEVRRMAKRKSRTTIY